MPNFGPTADPAMTEERLALIRMLVLEANRDGAQIERAMLVELFAEVDRSRERERHLARKLLRIVQEKERTKRRLADLVETLERESKE
jgi:hypothetical protein